jgi:hypothetical protein
MSKPRALILTGGSQAHDHKRIGPLLVDYLKDTGNIDPTLTGDKSILESPDLRYYDLCVFYITVRNLTNEQESNITSFVAEGKGFAGIHPSTVVSEENEKYIDMIGSQFINHSHYHEFPVTIKDKDHPITQGVSDFRISDELYVVDCKADNIHILANTDWEDKEVAIAYTKNYGEGRVFYLALGHDMAAWEHESFRKLLLQGVDWVAG